MSATAYRGWNLRSTGLCKCLLGVVWDLVLKLYTFEAKKLHLHPCLLQDEEGVQCKSGTPAYVVEIMTEFTGVSAQARLITLVILT